MDIGTEPVDDRAKEISRPGGAKEPPMPGTYSQILLHVVFSTKERKAQIKPLIQPRLFEYIGGLIRSEKGTLLAIGGMADHVHLLVRWRTDAAISDLMRIVKARSALWVHQNFPGFDDFAWQEGYAVFSVSKSAEGDVRRYIENQIEHHKGRDFKVELLALLRAHEIEFEEKYVFD